MISIHSTPSTRCSYTTSSSPSASKVAGSGMGPSITHRLDSYLVLMKFSILLSSSKHCFPSCLFLIMYVPIRGNMPSCQFCLPVPVWVSTWRSLHLTMTDLFALELPQRSTLCNCSSVQASRSTDLTLLICVPMPRCIPEHLQQSVLSIAILLESSVLSHTECKQICPGSSLPILGLCEVQM